MRRRDVAGLMLVAAVTAGLVAFRRLWFEPRDIALACLHGTYTPAVCRARDALGLATYHRVMGTGALAAGIAAIAGAPFAVRVAAVVLGVAGVIDYNVSWGMLGAALGAWAWMRPPAGP